jgi:hypothetical protein
MKKGYSEIPNVVAGQDDGAGDLSSSTFSSATASNSRMRSLRLHYYLYSSPSYQGKQKNSFRKFHPSRLWGRNNYHYSRRRLQRH